MCTFEASTQVIMSLSKATILAKLQSDILRLEGFKSERTIKLDNGLTPILDALPNGSLPIGAVHEFLTTQAEDAASTGGFIAGLLSSLMSANGATLWISSSRKVFPPGLKMFGIEPDRFIFIDLQKEKDVIWATEEALKCSSLSAVVAEIKEIDFTESRRLQLAVEQSQVTGFIIRNNYRKLNTTACVSRWKITPQPSESHDDLPGICFPKWRVELLRIKNGKPGVWSFKWMNGRFVPVQATLITTIDQQKKAG